LLAQAAYGLTELNREAVRQSNHREPGMLPGGGAVGVGAGGESGHHRSGDHHRRQIGISGAGRGLDLKYHLARRTSVSAYALGGHRHLPEIVQELTAMWPHQKRPQLSRERCACGLAKVRKRAERPSHVHAAPDPDDPWHSFDMLCTLYPGVYRPAMLHKTPFESCTATSTPASRSFASSIPRRPVSRRAGATCLVYPTVDVRTDRLVVVSVLDNLVKGASGQAVQNMNLMLGFPETVGLDAPAVYP
jgi:N-acetyl-gamma-glutamyl-phosphate reductase